MKCGIKQGDSLSSWVNKIISMYTFRWQIFNIINIIKKARFVMASFETYLLYLATSYQKAKGYFVDEKTIVCKQSYSNCWSCPFDNIETKILKYLLCKQIFSRVLMVAMQICTVVSYWELPNPRHHHLHSSYGKKYDQIGKLIV